MDQTHVTLTGYVGGDVTLRRAGDTEVASFRLALTPRRRDRATQEWRDAPTQWWTVNAWRLLGRHCSQSLRRGDPVVVHGRVEARTWTTAAGVETTTLEVIASSVGHDLNRGTSSFARAVRPAGAEQPDAVPQPEVDDAVSSSQAEEPAMATSSSSESGASPGRAA